MNDLEARLQQMLTEKVATVAADQARHHVTIRRARSRRVGTALLAVVVLLGVAAGGATVVRTLAEPHALAPAEEGEGEAGLDWDATLTNDYPEIARGTIQGRDWSLLGRRAELAPGVDEVVLELVVEGSGEGNGSLSATTRVMPSDDELLIEQLVIPGENARAVFGATLRSARSVEAVLDDGMRISGFLVTDYDSRSTITANYFVMFASADQDGYVFARDHLGIDDEREPIGTAPELDREASPLISGAFDGMSWSVARDSSPDQMCLNVILDGMDPAGRCFAAGESSDGLLLHAEEIDGQAKALVGFIPFDHEDLKLTIEGRTMPLPTPFPVEPHEALGFPYAVVIAADAHGSVGARTPSGEEVSIEF